MIELKIGMATEDGSIRILDEDRLCYKVLSHSKNAEGVRTISKELLAEWVPCVEKNPTKNSFEVRDMLSGKSDIDKFEYGYAATLKKMAEMILGRLNVVLPEADFSEEFVNWFAEHRGKGKTNTAEKYLGYFRTITNPYQEPTNSYWHGLYKVVYGKNAEKKVVAIGTLDEFDQVYGDLIVALEKKVKGKGMVDNGFQKAIDWFWKPEVKPHTCVTSALNAYRDFLEWRESQRSNEGEKPNSQNDPLTVALCYFKARRNEFAEGLKINDGVRAYFSPLTPQKLRAYSQEEFEDLFLGKEKYEHMWAGTNGKGWGHIQKAGRGASMNFIASICDKAIPAEQFCDKKFAAPSGFGPVVVAELNLKFHPTEYCAYSKRTAQALEILGLKKNTYTSGFTAAEYNEVLKQTEVIRGKMESMSIGLTREDDSRPDYLSANEFIDFVCNYEDELKKEFSKKEPELPKNVDRLALALKLFEEGRYGEEWQTNVIKDSYLHIFKVCETAADDLRKMSLEEFKEKFLDRVWAFQNGGSRKYGQLSEEERVGYRDFVVSVIPPIKSFGDYFPPSEKCPRGMGVGMISELLMRFHPDACCSYNDQLIHDALVTLGLAEGEFEWPKTPSIYQDFMGKCAKILRKMEEMKFARTPVEGDKDKPNYITVNEFLWFVHDHKDLIKEEIMKEQLKPIEADKSIKKGTRKLTDAFKDDAMLQRLAAALRTKPFAILAGHSGTGKSLLVRRLAYMTCNNEKLIKEGEGKTAPGNYCMVQVKPNWHDSTDLLGYYSDLNGRHFVNTPFVQFLCKAYAYPQTPFFLCLDEMNLAPVEQYFAEYLSAVESMDEKDNVWLTDSLVDVAKEGDGKVDTGVLMQIMQGAPSTEAAEWITKHGLTIPKNLFVVGTVNMDETTCQFSRKVLDRAMTLLMNEVKFDTMGKSVDPKEEQLLDEDGLKFFLDGKRKGVVGADEVGMLNKINGPLENTAFVVAYRFANEYALYEAALAKLRNIDAPSQVAAEAMDHVVLMKLLPRIHGERADVKQIFVGKDGSSGLAAALPQSLSKTQMECILNRSGDYLTFWP